MVQISAAAPGPLGRIKCHWPYGDPWWVPWHWEHMSWGPEAGLGHALAGGSERTVQEASVTR